MPGQAPFTARTPADTTRAIKPIHYNTNFNGKQGTNLSKAYDMRGILRPIDLEVAGDIFYSYIDSQDVDLRNQLMDEMNRRFRGLQYKPSADIAIRDAAVTPAQLVAGATFQGFALVPGSRVLLATGAGDSFIYEVQAAGAAVIAPDSTIPNLEPSSSVRIQEGDFAERMFILENNTAPAPGDVLNWQPEAIPILTNAGAGIGYDATTNSYYIRNDDGSVTIDPDGVHISAQYTNDMIDRINAAVAPLITRLDALENLTQQHTTQIAGLTSEVAQLRQRMAAAEGRLTDAEGRLTTAEGDIRTLELLDWTVPFPGDAAGATQSDAETTLVTIDLTKARWFQQLGLTLDILNSFVYVANTGGGVRQIEPANGLIISADGRTGYLEFSPRADAGTILLHRMQDARVFAGGSVATPPPAPAAATPTGGSGTPLAYPNSDLELRTNDNWFGGGNNRRVIPLADASNGYAYEINGGYSSIFIRAANATPAPVAGNTYIARLRVRSSALPSNHIVYVNDFGGARQQAVIDSTEWREYQFTVTYQNGTFEIGVENPEGRETPVYLDWIRVFPA